MIQRPEFHFIIEAIFTKEKKNGEILPLLNLRITAQNSDIKNFN